MRGGLDMAGENVADGTPRLQCRVKPVDSRTRHAEAAGDAFLFENENCRIDGAHPGHVSLLPVILDGGNLPAGTLFFNFFKIFFHY
jgi:hypothetical protein